MSLEDVNATDIDFCLKCGGDMTGKDENIYQDDIRWRVVYDECTECGHTRVFASYPTMKQLKKE